MPEYPRSPFKRNDTSITPKVDGDSIDATVIGEKTPAAGLFTEVDIDNQLELVNTTTNTTGVIRKGSDRFIHNFQDPTGDSAVPTGKNTFVGIDAGNFNMGSTATSVDHGSHNVGVGCSTINSNTTGHDNSAIGSYALYSNITGYSNSAVGSSALIVNTTGYNNSAIGEYTLSSNIAGTNNSAIGFYAGRQISGGSASNTTGDFNVFLGANTKALADNDQNEIVIGYDATGAGSNTVTIGNDSITNTILKGDIQGTSFNNQMASKAAFDILDIMADPRFLNIQCDDPGAGTMVDVSGQGNDGTYHGTMTSGDRVKLGMGWAVDPDGSNDYISLVDSNDFSFGDGTNDEVVTWLGVIEVVDTALNQMFMSKTDNTTGVQAREWIIQIRTTEQLRFSQYDESANVSCYVDTDNALSVGLHSLVITSPGDGGATAMNNVKVYIDGISVALTVTNNASYVAMENTATIPLIGSYQGSSGAAASFFHGDIALTGIDGSEWSAKSVWRFHQLCKGLYGI